MLTFEHIWAFALLPMPLLVLWLTPARVEKRAAVRTPMFDELARKAGVDVGKGAVVRRRGLAQKALFIVVWAAALIALAKPQWLKDPIVKEKPMRDLLLAVDLSGSMETEDFVNAAGETTDRLTAVKEVLDDFLTRRDGDRVGLVVFGNAPYTQIPFTQDLDVCRVLLGQTAARMAGPRTAFGDAIGLGINLFERSETPHKVMIALTDGNDTHSMMPPAEAARIARDNDILIHTIAVGDPSAAGEEKLDEEALQDVAETTGGKYFFAQDREALASIYDEIDKMETREVETISYRPRLELFHWPLGFILVLSLCYHFSRMIGQARLMRRIARDIADGERSTEASA